MEINLRSVIVSAALLAGWAGSGAGQRPDRPAPASRPGESLARTMREFVDAVAHRRPAGFFPRRGDWRWVVTTHWPSADGLGIWRFPASQTDTAMSFRGPVCGSFNSADAGTAGALLEHTGGERPPPWRRVRGTRFVPAGAPDRSPVFVEWRREDDRWIVSAFGDERYHDPPLLGIEVNSAWRDPLTGTPLRLPLPPDGRYAGSTAWYRQHEPIVVEGRRLVKYGLPRVLGAGDVVRFGSYDGVPVYVERRDMRRPVIVYIPVSTAGEFQPYQDETGDGCGG